MPEITADELATALQRLRDHYRINQFRPDLLDEQWDHIIACLREHEERAAGCDPDDPDEAEQFQKFWSKVVSDHQDNPLSVGDAYRLKMRLFNDRFGLAAAKSAVEKAVRNG